MRRLSPRLACCFVLLVGVVLAACTTSVPSLAPSTPPPVTTPTPSATATALASVATLAPTTPFATAPPSATPQATPSATQVAWTEIPTDHTAWSPDGAQFVTGYTDGTELRNTAFDVIRTYPLLRRAAWLDATHLVGYQSPVDYWSAGYTSAAVPVMVDVNSGETQESDMPFGVSGSPMSNGYGWTVVAKPVSRIEWNYVVWSPDAATRKREGAPNGWSNDGSKLTISHQSGMTHWPEVLSWPDDQTLYEDRTIGLSGTIDFDPSGNYVSFDMSTDEFATTHALRIVNLRSQAVEDIPLGESDAESFWTADGRLSVLDRDTLAVRVFDPDGTQVDSYVARFPDVWASDDGSSVAFFNEEDNTQIEVIRHGDASSVDAPATGWGSVYFSPDGSVMVFWQDRTREFLRKV